MAKILVIDENAAARANLTEQLNSLGHEVTGAVSGQHGCNVTEDPGGFHFAFVSAVMPDMDGLETTRALKHLCPAMPVYMTVGKSKLRVELISRLALALGADRVLQSPITNQVLRSLLGGS